MPEQLLGTYEILENSNKFDKLNSYDWEEKDENFIENEKIFFYEICTSILNTDNFGLNTISYDLFSTENIKDNVFLHKIKI
jgi:hypothetical protein